MPSQTSTDFRWRGLINDFQRSGLTHAEFCRRRAISLHTFRKRLYGQKALTPGLERKAEPVPPEPTRFVPVTLTPNSDLVSVPRADPLTIILPAGWRIVVGEGFDPETLHRLIDTIEPSR